MTRHHKKPDFTEAEALALLTLIREAHHREGVDETTLEHALAASRKIVESGVNHLAGFLPDGRIDFSDVEDFAPDDLDFSDLGTPIDPAHLRLDEQLRGKALLNFLTPRITGDDDDFPPGAVVSEVNTLALLGNIRLFLGVLDEGMRLALPDCPALARQWEEKRQQLLDGESEAFFNFLRYYERFADKAFFVTLMMAVMVMFRDAFDDNPAEAEQLAVGLFKTADVAKAFEAEMKKIMDYGAGRRHKRVPPEGTEFVLKAWSVAFGMTKMQDGKVHLPGGKQVVDAINGQRKKVTKRLTLKAFYERLKADGLSWTELKKRLAANYD